MSVPSTDSRISYTGNGSTSTAYVVPFYFFEDEHLEVYIDDSLTPLVLDTDYAVTGADDEDGGGITTTIAYDNTHMLAILRVVPLDQQTTYTRNGDFPAATHERALDKLTMIVQQLQRQIDRAIRVPDTREILAKLDAAEADGIVGFDADGNAKIYNAAALIALLQIDGDFTVTVPEESVGAQQIDSSEISAIRAKLDTPNFLEQSSAIAVETSRAAAAEAALSAAKADQTDLDIEETERISADALKQNVADDVPAAKVGLSALKSEVTASITGLVDGTKIISTITALNQSVTSPGTAGAGASYQVVGVSGTSTGTNWSGLVVQDGDFIVVNAAATAYVVRSNAQTTRIAAQEQIGLVTGVVTGSGSGLSFTATSLIDTTFVVTSGTPHNVVAPIRSVANGEKVTLFVYVTGASPSVQMRLSASGISASNSLTVSAAGSYFLTLTATSSANELQIYKNTGTCDVTLRYVLLPGDWAATSTSSTTKTILTGILALLKLGLDTTDTSLSAIAHIGLSSATPSNYNSATSFTANGFADASTTIQDASNRGIQQTIYTVPQNTGATLLYRIVGGASITPRAQLFQNGVGSAGSAVTLNADGGLHAVSLSTSTRFANQVLLTSLQVGTFRIAWALIPGVSDSTSLTGSGTGSMLIQALRSIAADSELLHARVNTLYESWSAADKDVLFSSDAFLIAGRPLPIFGRNVVATRRRQTSLDVGVVLPAADNTNGRPIDAYANPQAFLDPDASTGTALRITVKDPTLPTQRIYKDVTVHRVGASQSVSFKVVWVGDSLAAHFLRPTKALIAGTGASVTFVGTRNDPYGNAYEGRSGCSTSNYIGRTTNGDYLSFSWPWHRPADATDKSNYPDMCWTITTPSGRAVEETFTENPSFDGDYRIFDWAPWITAVGTVSVGDNIVLVLVLGTNDGTDAPTTSLDILSQGQEYIIQNFLATFSNGKVVLACPPLSSDGSGGDSTYLDIAAIIKRKIKQFGGRGGERIYLASDWASMNRDFGWQLSTTSTDPDSGAVTANVSDYIHPGATSAVAQQHAEVTAAAVIYAALQ